VVDSHCHLADAAFAPDLGEVVARARSAGVKRALVVLAGGDTEEADRAASIEALWPGVCFAIGVHPHTAREFADSPGRATDVVRAQLARIPAARAVGEIGLDYHYDFSPRRVQQEIFRAQIRLARDLGLPVIVHTREAEADTIAILREEGRGDLRGVLHCFTGTAVLASVALDLGFYVSLAGIITFPRATDLRHTVSAIPAKRLMVETDSPYLAPVPHRGGRNEPAHLAQVVAALADLQRTDPETVARETSANFHALFGP
jgi:TatD DNase family protein